MAQPVEPRVSIIIVNWNGKRYLDRCLASIARQSYPNVETVLVDNGSSDGSLEHVRARFPWVRLVPLERNFGFAVGNNVGIQATAGDLVALVNNDTELSPTWLERLVEAVQASDTVAGACGAMYSLEQPDRCLFTLTKIDATSALPYWINQPSPRRSVDYLMGSGMVVRRGALEQVGLLDPAYVAYFEETDLCARLIRAGYELVFVPEAVFWHKEGGSTRSEWREFMMARNRIRFALKNFDLRALPAALAITLGGALPAIWTAAPGERLRLARLFAHAWAWNLVRFPSTLRARRRDLARLGRHRSYNRSLPLRDVRADRRGGYVADEPRPAQRPRTSR